MIWPFLSYLDLFQNNVALFFNNRIKRSTKLGFFFTITLVILLSYYFSQSDIFLKSSPNVVSQTLTDIHANPIIFDENHLMAVTVSDDNNKNYLDPRIFSVVFEIFHSKSLNGTYDTTWNETKILEPCTENDVNFDRSAFKRLGLLNALCLRNKSFDLEGYWDEEETRHAEIKLYPCDNETIQNDTCKTPDEISDFFSSSNPKYFGATYHGVALKVDDYANPMKMRYEYQYVLIDLPFFKKINIFFKNTVLNTIDGWLFRDTDVKTSFLKDFYDMDVGFRTDPTEIIAKITLYASHDYTENNRRYQSLIEVLAYMAGLANFYILSCLIFTNIQSYLNSMKIIMNSLYFFQKIEKSETKKPKSYKIEPKPKKSCKPEKHQEKMENEKDTNENENEVTENKPNITINENLEKIETKNQIYPRETTEMEIFSPMKIDLFGRGKNENVTYGTEGNINPGSPKIKSVFFEENKDLNNEKSLSCENRISSDKKFNDIKCFESKVMDNKFNEIKKSDNDPEPLSAELALQKKNKELTKNCYKLEIGFFEFIRFLLTAACGCRKSPKQQLIEKANKIFMREMDIISILKKSHEVEKLKLIMLNEDQLILFNSLSKPLVLLGDSQSQSSGKTQKSEISSALKMTNYIKNYSDIRRKSKFNMAYENVMRLSTFNEFNRRLMELVDQNIQNFRKNENII